MATYVNNLRLKEIATGDSAGTWGTETNTNLELIGQAFGYGTRAIANASTDNITIADGASDADRSMYLKLTGGGQACTVSLLPNTASKIYIMENATAYTLTFSQGSGANVAVLAGEVKVIAGDGLGSGAVVYDLLTDVNLAGTTKTAGLTNAGALSNQGTITVGVDDTGYDVKFFGATSGKFMQWDESADSLLVAGTVNVAGTVEFDGLSGTGAVSVTNILDEDDLVSDSATALATQQSIKAYVDAQVDTVDTLAEILAVGNVTGGTDLDISIGDDLTTLTAGTSNFRAGVNAGNSIIAGGNYNTVVGDEAGTAITTGDYNTAAGFSAGTAITTGEQNVIIGALAGDALTDADFNVAIGLAALSADTLGSRSTAIGHGALENQNFTSATDTYNTAVGYVAGLSITTGTHNTAIGGLALDANTTGHSNVGVGYNSLTSNTTANYITAVGFHALRDNTTGTGNSSFGASALQSNTTGTNNSAFGYDSLANSTTASNNTAVGYASLGANTTGANNVAIGYNALDANTTASYNVAIGHDALGAATGENNTGIGHRAGTHTTTLTTGSSNTLIGAYVQTSASDSTYANVMGYNVVGESGYTTVGKNAEDIRAAHGVATWATVSDERYKKSITDCTAGLSFINSLRSVTWNYKTLGELPETFSAYEEGSTEVFKNTQTNHGFIAQEVKVAIDADSGLKDGFRLWDDREDGSQEVAEAALIPILVKAIQELTARLETLEG